MIWPDKLRLRWPGLAGRRGSSPAPELATDGDDEDLSVYLRRLQTFTRSWPGEPLDAEGLLRRLNPAGSRPPLLWCYNSEHEFGRMGAALGPDQPLVGMRSLNKVAPTGPERHRLADRLADHYARLLTTALHLGRCAVGGNCQSAALATRLALQLLRAGRRVDLLLTLEATPPVPYPGRVALLFGAESESHNPFLGTPRPQDLWQAIHREVGWSFVPGSHGRYFAEANVGPLCATIRDRLAAAQAAPPPGPGPEARLLVRGRPEPAATASSLVVRAEVQAAGPAARRPFHVRPLWSSDAEGPWAPPNGSAQAVHRIEAGRRIDLVLATPDRPGRWRLRLVLCQEGAGPLGWRGEADPALAIDLQEAELPA